MVFLKNEIETVNGDKAGEYRKDFMEIKFNLDDNLPLNKILNFHMLAIFVRSVLEEDDNYYSQIYLDGCLHEL